MKNSYYERQTSISNKLSTNFPKTAKCFVYMKEVWCETFPDEEKAIKTKIQNRRQAAKL
jgi:hypothetical protein